MFSSEWQSAHRILLQNLQQQPSISQIEVSVHTDVHGRKTYLPAYIPYIGLNYFEYRPRILCYAINQNLSPHVRWTEDWINRWVMDIDESQDRLNRSILDGRPMPIKPYTEGFIPLVALLGISRSTVNWGNYLPTCIEDVISVTNFVKFSTSRDASSSTIPNIWWQECGLQYVMQEIQVLCPDIIIGFGQKTIEELRNVLSKLGTLGSSIELLGCRFPARIPSVKSRPLSRKESNLWKNRILPLIDKIREPKANSYHKCRIQNYPGYFIDVLTSWNANGGGDHDYQTKPERNRRE